MDYASLRREGIRLLERMAGQKWTDFNAHDPGITILEQLCYALTDLGYRAGHAIPDLLAEGGSDPYANLHPPSEILTCRPVTLADLRRLVIDVQGVKNAWVEVIQSSSPTLYYHPDSNELSVRPLPPPPPPPAEQVSLLGLYRVLIEAAEDPSGGLSAQVARRLHQNRGLGEDFAEIRVLSPQLIQVDATIEIGLIDDAEQVRQAIEQRIADEISPPVTFVTLEALLRAGLPADEIFTGPRLDHGFITDEVLQRANRRTAINTSDLIHAIMDAPGVRAVRRIRIATGRKTGTGTAGPADEPWSLAVQPNSVPRFDRAGSIIVLTREGKVVPRATPAPSRSELQDVSPSPADMTPPVGRNRNVSQYWSVQNHFPALYGVGELGLTGSAPPARRAQAKQLRAYLMFFDQLMANYVAQLAHVKDLFAYGGTEARTYFTQPLHQEGLGFEELRIDDMATKVVASLENGDPSHERKSRFLNHLLARFAETMDAHDALMGEALTRNKQALLQGYPWLSSARGTAFNYLLPPGPTNTSALEERLRLKLGLMADHDETFILVEHILLRPMEGDELQKIPLLSAALHEDPYSLQLTFVLRYGAGRFPKDDTDQTDFADVLARLSPPDPVVAAKLARATGFRDLIEQTIRTETPAHLTTYVRWMTDADYKVFSATYTQWLLQRRQYIAQQLTVNLEELG